MFPTGSATRNRRILMIGPDGSVKYSSADVTDLEHSGRLPARIFEELSSGARVIRMSSEAGEIDLSVHHLGLDEGWLLISEHPAVAAESPSGVPDIEEMAYRSFFEQAPVGIVHLNKEGYVTFENHALREIVGVGPEDTWLGRHVRDVALLSQTHVALINGVLASGATLDAVETEVQKAKDEHRQLQIVGSPIRNFDSAVVGCVLTVQDVTEARRAEELSRRARLAAEQASQMKSALIATISHELRTPAGTIHGFASMLEQELRDLGAETIGSGVPIEFAETIRQRAADLVRLVGDLSELSQLETGAIHLQTETVDVAAIVSEVLSNVPELPSTLEVEICDCVSVHAHADRLRLSHVIEKIVDNAVKFTSDGYVRVRCTKESGSVCIEVSDTGVGIDRERLDLVFDPFQQEDDPLSRRFEGAGLGLSIVRRLVEMMSGSVVIESEKDVGTTVRIYLPASDPKEAPDS